MKSFAWDDLRIFLAIFREGNLSSAARELKISQPTVSRRLANLEESLAARLFDRLPDGLIPTAAGSELVSMAEQMEKAANAVVRRQPSMADTIQGSVRISVYEPVSVFIIDNLQFIRSQLPEVEIEIAVAHLEANLSRREADLQIRECRPETPGLVSRRLGKLAYAVYASHDYVKQNPAALTDARYDVCDWIGMDDDHANFTGQRWMRGKLGGPPTIRGNNGIVIYDAVCRHAGLAVLPCFHGDANADLTRVTSPLAEATATHYLLVHQDLRNLPVVRAMMNVLIELYESKRDVLLGKADSKANAA